VYTRVRHKPREGMYGVTKEEGSSARGGRKKTMGVFCFKRKDEPLVRVAGFGRGCLCHYWRYHLVALAIWFLGGLTPRGIGGHGGLWIRCVQDKTDHMVCLYL